MSERIFDTQRHAHTHRAYFLLTVYIVFNFLVSHHIVLVAVSNLIFVWFEFGFDSYHDSFYTILLSQ